MKAVAQKEEDRTKAALISVIIHAILLALLFFLHTAVKEPVFETPPIEINWGGDSDPAPGTPDAGQGNSPAPVGEQLESPVPETPTEKPQPAKPTPTTPTKTSRPTAPNTPTSSEPDVAALRRAEEAAARRQEEQRAEQARIAEQERLRKEQEERDKKKGTFGSQFGKPGATGPGQGNNGKPGNQGQPGGGGTNPDGTGGQGTGVGESIGGGLSGRKVVGRPRMVDDTQNTGRVAVRVCVGSDGSVSSASYTQLGSTTTDSVLRSKAESWARQYRFAQSDASEQCGTITFDFKVK